MGVRLIVEVLDCAEVLTPTERLLLVALAEKASDDTRRVLWARGDDPRAILRHRTGLSDSGLTKTFRRLAARDLDPRVPLAIDKHGRPVFAYEGAVAEYVVPTLRACPTRQALVVESLPSEAPSGGREPALQGPSACPTGQAPECESLPSRAGLVPPSLDDPSIDARESLPAEAPSALQLVPVEHQRAVTELIARHGSRITEQDAVDCVAWVAANITPTNLAGYLARFSEVDVRGRAEQHRADGSTKTDSTSNCPHGVYNGLGVLGVGPDASRRCGRCEQSTPAGSVSVGLLPQPRTAGARSRNDIDWEAAAARAAARDAASEAGRTAKERAS